MLQTIYNKLLHYFSNQGWWPVTDPRKKFPTYRERKQLTEKQQLEIMIGAILTQNTAWKNVEKVMVQLLHQNLIDVKKLLAIRKEALAKLIKSSGYHNQKAIKLKHLAKFIAEHPIKELEKLPTENLRELLLSVHGIGKETADSILLYAFQRPIFVIDAYTKRIMARIGVGEEGISYDALQKTFMQELPRNAKLYNAYHALLVEHGKNICRKKPLCEECPIKEQCKYYRRFFRVIGLK